MLSTISPISRSHLDWIYSKLYQIEPTPAELILLSIQAVISFCRNVLFNSSRAAAESKLPGLLIRGYTGASVSVK